MTPQEFSNEYKLDAMELDHDRGFIIRATFINLTFPHLDKLPKEKQYIDYKEYSSYYGGDSSQYHPASLLGRWHKLNTEADRFKYFWYRYTLTLKILKYHKR